MKKIIVVIGCFIGIVYIFMVEEVLKIVVKKLNVEIKVEINGVFGVENVIMLEDLKDIYGVIIVVDKDVNVECFNGLLVIEVLVKEVIYYLVELINKVVNGQVLCCQGFFVVMDLDEKYE